MCPDGSAMDMAAAAPSISTTVAAMTSGVTLKRSAAREIRAAGRLSSRAKMSQVSAIHPAARRRT